jgi:predicted dehydrogenase
VSVGRSLFPPDPDQPVGVAVIGCGYWGRNYVRVLHELPVARVEVVCDASPDRLATIGRAFPGIPLVSSVREALAVPGVEAAVVCTPASSHCAVAGRCLRGGVHTLVEKPLTTCTEDADALVEAADEEDLILMTGHTFIYNAGIRKAREYLESDALGRVYYLYARRTNLGPIRDDVDAIWDLAPHDVSIFNFLLGGLPEWVSAVGACLLCEDRADVGFVSLGYSGGVVAHSHVSWAEPNKTREVVIVGSDKRIVFDDLDALERVRVFDKGIARAPSEASTYGEFGLLLRNGDITSPMIKTTEPLKAQCAHFVASVRTCATPLTDGRAGRDVVSVMEAIDRSVTSGGARVAVATSRPKEQRESPARRQGAHSLR